MKASREIIGTGLYSRNPAPGTDYKTQLLTLLIGEYEDNPQVKQKKQPRQRKYLYLYSNTKWSLPAYDIEKHQVRKDINQAVLDLAALGFIGYSWEQGQKDHIISCVWLNYDAVEQVYAHLGRQPEAEKVDNLLDELAELLEKTESEWSRNWLQDAIEWIVSHRYIGPSVIPKDEAERRDLLTTLLYLDKNRELETLERVFSMKCFGDSKQFERTARKHLVRILKKYLVQDDCNDEEALHAVGIVPYPEQFAFSGALSMIFPRGEIDFSLLASGATLSLADIAHGRIKLGKGLRRIMTIENLANYVDYIRKSQKSDELIIYHGGHLSPARCAFLRSVTSSLPEQCGFYHWGDIDYGGFLMLARLRRDVLSSIQPWRMDKEEMERFSGYTTAFSEDYKKRLSSLLVYPELSDCYGCIEHMISSGARLEQEAMLI